MFVQTFCFLIRDYEGLFVEFFVVIYPVNLSSKNDVGVIFAALIGNCFFTSFPSKNANVNKKMIFYSTMFYRIHLNLKKNIKNLHFRIILYRL
jgi:hypothetical protein